MTRDTALHQCGWKQANAIWHHANDALMRRDYGRFDKLMIEFRSISDTWKSTARDGDAANNSSPQNQ